MNAAIVVGRNFAQCTAYDDRSFVGRLHEEMRWDWDEFCLLEKALYELVTDGELRRETAWPLFRIFSYVPMLLGCHFNPGDVFARKGLFDEDVHASRERFPLVFDGFYAGKMPTHGSLDPPKPLLSSIGH